MSTVPPECMTGPVIGCSVNGGSVKRGFLLVAGDELGLVLLPGADALPRPRPFQRDRDPDRQCEDEVVVAPWLGLGDPVERAGLAVHLPFPLRPHERGHLREAAAASEFEIKLSRQSFERVEGFG